MIMALHCLASRYSFKRNTEFKDQLEGKAALVVYELGALIMLVGAIFPLLSLSSRSRHEDGTIHHGPEFRTWAGNVWAQAPQAPLRRRRRRISYSCTMA